MLDQFWKGHRPFGNAVSRQYMSAIFCHNEQQFTLAEDSKQKQERLNNKKINTQILKTFNFFPAEDYHQKYGLRQNKLFYNQFQRMYPQVRDLVNSTAAARVNGILQGYGSPDLLMHEIRSYGLSNQSGEELIRIVKARNPVKP